MVVAVAAATMVVAVVPAAATLRATEHTWAAAAAEGPLILIPK